MNQYQKVLNIIEELLVLEAPNDDLLRSHLTSRFLETVSGNMYMVKVESPFLIVDFSMQEVECHGS